MRLISELWVSALCRRVSVEGASAYVAKRGAKEAGAIFVMIDDLRGTVSLFGPAPQLWIEEEVPTDRLFEGLVDKGDRDEVCARLDREQRFDPDIWIVEIEDRDGRSFVEVVGSSNPV